MQNQSRSATVSRIDIIVESIPRCQWVTIEQPANAEKLVSDLLKDDLNNLTNPSLSRSNKFFLQTLLDGLPLSAWDTADLDRANQILAPYKLCIQRTFEFPSQVSFYLDLAIPGTVHIKRNNRVCLFKSSGEGEEFLKQLHALFQQKMQSYKSPHVAIYAARNQFWRSSEKDPKHNYPKGSVEYAFCKLHKELLSHEDSPFSKINR